jgi:hypothetical protein
MQMQKNPKSADQDDKDKRHADELLDEALEETFPASDPLGLIPLDGVRVGAGPKKPPRK